MADPSSALPSSVAAAVLSFSSSTAVVVATSVGLLGGSILSGVVHDTFFCLSIPFLFFLNFLSDDRVGASKKWAASSEEEVGFGFPVSRAGVRGGPRSLVSTRRTAKKGNWQKIDRYLMPEKVSVDLWYTSTRVREGLEAFCRSSYVDLVCFLRKNTAASGISW